MRLRIWFLGLSVGCCGRAWVGNRGWGVQQGATQRQFLLAEAMGQEAELADAHKAPR